MWDDKYKDGTLRRFHGEGHSRSIAPSHLDAVLPYPHYTNDYWNTARLIWGIEQKCKAVNYSDRLWQWDYKAADQATGACKSIQPNTARWTQAWLSAYHGKPVTLRYVMAGCNLATGYAYYVYGYDYEGE